jgi:hypothetical protein
MSNRKAVLTPLQRETRNVPKGVTALYPLVPPNRPTPVFKGPLVANPGPLRFAPGRLAVARQLVPRGATLCPPAFATQVKRRSAAPRQAP